MTNIFVLDYLNLFSRLHIHNLRPINPTEVDLYKAIYKLFAYPSNDIRPLQVDSQRAYSRT